MSDLDEFEYSFEPSEVTNKPYDYYWSKPINPREDKIHQDGPSNGIPDDGWDYEFPDAIYLTDEEVEEYFMLPTTTVEDANETDHLESNGHKSPEDDASSVELDTSYEPLVIQNSPLSNQLHQQPFVDSAQNNIELNDSEYSASTDNITGSPNNEDITNPIRNDFKV